MLFIVQEELAENIASLVGVFHTPDTGESLLCLLHRISIILYTLAALQFIDAFFATISREWHSIDRLRLDKYYMVRPLHMMILPRAYRLLLRRSL